MRIEKVLILSVFMIVSVLCVNENALQPSEGIQNGNSENTTNSADGKPLKNILDMYIEKLKMKKENLKKIEEMVSKINDNKKIKREIILLALNLVDVITCKLWTEKIENILTKKYINKTEKYPESVQEIKSLTIEIDSLCCELMKTFKTLQQRIVPLDRHIQNLKINIETLKSMQKEMKEIDKKEATKKKKDFLANKSEKIKEIKTYCQIQEEVKDTAASESKNKVEEISRLCNEANPLIEEIERKIYLWKSEVEGMIKSGLGYMK